MKFIRVPAYAGAKRLRKIVMSNASETSPKKKVKKSKKPNPVQQAKKPPKAVFRGNNQNQNQIPYSIF